MINNDLKVFITKVGIFLCERNELSTVVKYFKEKIYVQSSFEKTDLYEIQVFINNLKDEELAKSSLESNIKELKGNISENQKLVIFLRAAIYYLLVNRDEIKKKLDVLTKIFNYKDCFLHECTSYVKNTVNISELNNKEPIEFFFELPEIVDKQLLLFITEIFNNGSHINKKILKRINPFEYEHELDRTAFEVLTNMDDFEIICRKVFEIGIEKIYMFQKMGSSIRVTENSFPELYRILRECCEIFDVFPIPQLYIEQGFINAYTIGSENHIIVLSSGAVGCLTRDELMFILGHELGHIKSGHAFYYWMANSILPKIGEIIGNVTLGIGNMLTKAVRLGLLSWARKSEFTADRAGLLVCQNYEAAIKTFMKISGAPIKYYNKLNVDDFLMQAAEFEGCDVDDINKLLKTLSIYDSEHPWTVMRASQLNSWVEDGYYERIMGIQRLGLIRWGDKSGAKNR